ncbi:Cytochrome P450 71A9 [Acorus calamus]|uniref:Cytochrome P450 71A9 n=1 Tax=Acorus calamus TaxID=4465 RepID=A0AAV9CQ32_ACOCL|nr:Cytochrome P450 71A9 [Acorus calamus]
MSPKLIFHSHGSTTTTLLFVVSIFLVSWLLTLKRRRSNTRQLPPGPTKLPIIGNLHQLGKSPHISLQKLSMDHGPLMHLQLGCSPTLVISSADAARDVFKSNDIAFSGRPALYALKKITYNLVDIAFAPYGEHWRQIRKMCMLELLSVKRVNSFWHEREVVVTRVMDSIATRCHSPDPIDLSAAMLTLTIDLTCRTAFGENTDTAMSAQLDRNFNELDAFYESVIEEHVHGGRPESGDRDLVDVLIRLQKDPIDGMLMSSPRHIKAILTDVFIAGSDTSSAALVWTMTELMKNPASMKKAQDEVRKAVQKNKHRVDETDLQHLHYLKLVIKESLRLHPPAPLQVPRETIEDCNIRGYDIPAKTRVFVNARAIGRDPKYWKDPNDFRPERFDDDDVRMIDFRGQDFQLLPFGLGRRGCPGINFAYVTIELTLANLLHRFDWTLPEGMTAEDVDMEDRFGMTMHKKIPLCLVAVDVLGK